MAHFEIKDLSFSYPTAMGSLKGIIFDKDGTLFDYGEVWGPVFSQAIAKGLARSSLSEDRKARCIDDFLKILGVDDKGNTYPDGIIFRHDRKITATLRILRLCIRYRLSPFMVGRAMFSFMKKTDLGLEERIESMEFPGVREVFEEAYKRGYILGIVTNDTLRSTSIFLKKMVCLHFQRSYRFKYSLVEGSAYGHYFACCLHLSSQTSVRLRELIKWESRELGNNIVDARLCTSVTCLCYRIYDFIKSKTNCNLSCQLSDRISCRFGSQGRRS